ncbi:hypothetical protein B0H12DRAFT_1228402 [Mycena haematopus]|nr:hypothetical protein B0H12DRAFT_1228402 [Mycena haematopus]
MSFIDRLIDNSSNKRRRLSASMPLFTQPTQHLNAPPVHSHRRHDRLQPSHDVDDLSSDLELSFASNVSLNSPPRDSLALTPESEYPKPMDISPAPPIRPMRPRAFTSGPRMFGQDRSNESIQSGPPASLKPGSTQSSGKRIQRSALPTEWFATTVRTPQEPAVFSAPPVEAGYPSDDAMDVDTSFEVPTVSIAAPQSAAPTITGFNALFYDTMSPAAPQPKKQRRSLSPDQVHRREQDTYSSPGLPSSPSQSKLERIVTGPLFPALDKPRVEGLGAPPNGLKRSRRPAFSTTVQTAYPTLDGEHGSPAEHALPPTRRAFSAVISGSPLEVKLAEQSSDESSFEGMSSPAQAYAKRQQVKTIRRCDGTDDFRPLTGATAMVLNESPSAKFLSAGIPGFGDNESAGKLLPCHRVTDDGLMRINSETLNNLLDGHYTEQADYHIIDCRFDYEFNGGHIRGAVNLNQKGDLEEFFLRTSLKKPKPSVSGDSGRKTILVFHCEFSAKRAPTFAKHLRAKDRALNNHVYPRIHYPELYILEGGYCQYYKSSSSRCLPQAYVTMDDPTHTASRDGGLDQLRKTKFGRHKSYTYGDASGLTKTSSLAQQQPKRNTVPAGPGSIFAAATVARTRRGSSLTTLAEDGNVTAEDTDEDLGDSPCPPPPKGAKKAPRPLARAETYGPTRTAY